LTIQESVLRGVEQAFTIADDVSMGVYTISSGVATYNATLDKQVMAASRVLNVRMLRTTLETEEREASQLTVTDIKVLVPGVDMQGAQPNETDTFTLDGNGYNVVTFRPVPGNALWIIYGRLK
jgi:hypothetical protein